MKNKKVSLRAWMFLKIAPSALVIMTYWINIRADTHPIFQYFESGYILNRFFPKSVDIFPDLKHQDLGS